MHIKFQNLVHEWRDDRRIYILIYVMLYTTSALVWLRKHEIYETHFLVVISSAHAC